MKRTVVALCGLAIVAAWGAVSLSPFGKSHHGHPTVATWYSESHKHPFNCEDMSPTHEHYSCKECPVGDPNRVVQFPHGEYKGVPIRINVWAACSNINMLIPEPSSWHDSDEFYCSREPADGYVVIDGHKISCKDSDTGEKQELGTINPGETITVPLSQGK